MNSVEIVGTNHNTEETTPQPDAGLRAFIERRCPLQGKTRFATKAEARRVVARSSNLTSAYRCMVCEGYHVASSRRGHRF